MGEQYSKLAEANKPRESNNGDKTVKGYKDANNGRYQRPRHYKTYRPIGFVGVPSETSTFVGREHELGELEAALTKSKCAILQALPGVGKSSLIVAYLRTQKDMYRNVIWLNSESVNSIVQELNQVALKFKIRSESQVLEMHDFLRAEILEIYAALCEHPTMIVFNNAPAYKDTPEEGIQRFLPPPSPGFFPKVIITTSFSTEWHQLQKECSMLFLNSFSEEDSRELILKVFNSSTVPDIDANWSKIARYFENLPIAIQSAACVIKTFANDRVPKSCYTTQNFLDEFTLDEPSESTGGSDSSAVYQKLEALWERVIEKLEQIFGDKGKQAVRLLKLLAFLSPDGVEVKVLFGILRRINSVIDVDVHLRDVANPALELLVSLSLVKSRGKYVAIHSLLQKNLMKLMTENGELIKYAVTLAQNINGRRTDFVSQEYYRQIHAFGKSIQRILHHPKILNALEANIDILEQFPYTAGSIAYAAIYDTQICFKGIYHEDSIETREALIHHNQRYCKAKGKPTSIQSDRVFQQEEMNLDERQTIEKYLRDTTRLRNGQYEHESQNSAMGQYTGEMALEDHSENGAERMERNGYPEILTFLESDLSRQRLSFGADDDRTIETRNKLADHLTERGMYAAALKLLIEDLARQRCVLGPDDPRTIGTRDTLLNSLRRQNKPELAMELLKLDLLRQHLCFGLDDVRTIETRKQLMKELSESRNYAELGEMLKYDLFRQRSKLGSDDPRTLDSRNNLAEQLFLRGSHDEAISLMNNDLLGQTADLGPDDPQTISTRNLLMDQLQRFLNDDQPVRILQLHFNRQRSSLGPDDPRTIQTRNLFIDHLMRVSENYDEKLQIFQSGLPSNPCENQGLDQPLLEERQKNWFAGAFDLLESDESRLKYKQIMDQPKAVETKMAEIAELIAKETHVKYIPDTDAVNESTADDVHSSVLHIQLRDQLSKQMKLAKLRDLSAQLYLPKASQHLQSDMTEKQRTYVKQHRNWHVTACEILESDLMRQETKHGRYDLRTIETRNFLISLLLVQQKHAEAITLLQAELSNQQSANGPDLPQIISIRNEMIEILQKQNRHAEPLGLLHSDLIRQLSNFGPNDTRTLATRDYLLRHLLHEDMWGSAIEMLKYELSRQILELGPDDERTIATRNLLFQYLTIMDGGSEATELLRSDLHRQRTVLGQDDYRTLATRNLLTEALILQEGDQVLQILIDDLKRQLSQLGPDNPLTIDTRNRLLEAFVQFQNK